MRKSSRQSYSIFISVVRDYYASLKPERDSSVANRLIGAALGIRLPSNLTKSNQTKAGNRAPSPPMEDAWD